MRILTLTNLFPDSHDERNGIFLYRQLQGIQQEGAKIEVWLAWPICPWPLYLFKRWREWGPERKPMDFPGVKVTVIRYLRLPGGWFNRWSGLFLYFASRNRLKGRRDEFDRLYGYDIFPSGDAAVRLGKRYELPTLCSAIGVDLVQTSERNEDMRRHTRWILNGTVGVVACGKELADAVYHYAKKDSIKLYGVVDLEVFKPPKDRPALRLSLQLPVDAPVMTFSGYLIDRKGVQELISAFEAVSRRHPKLNLIICGDGPERESMKRRLRAAKLENQARFCGNVPPEEMIQWFQVADFFVLPSKCEGVPNALMEAMACGVPCIAGAVGGVPDAVGTDGGLTDSTRQPGDLSASHRNPPLPAKREGEDVPPGAKNRGARVRY